MELLFFFGITFSFVCPVCHKLNIEKAGAGCPTDDPEKLKQRLAMEGLKCRNCKSPLPDGTQATIDVQPGTLESLKKAGFPFPPNM